MRELIGRSILSRFLYAVGRETRRGAVLSSSLFCVFHVSMGSTAEIMNQYVDYCGRSSETFEIMKNHTSWLERNEGCELHQDDERWTLEGSSTDR